jgi:hypothetical protein
VKTANRSFYESFQVSKEETENRSCTTWETASGNSRPRNCWIILSRNESVHDFEVEHSFPNLGRKIMLLNARPFPPDSKHPELILLAVEDVSALRERADELAEANRHKDDSCDIGSRPRNPLADSQRRALPRHGGLNTRCETGEMSSRQVGSDGATH